MIAASSEKGLENPIEVGFRNSRTGVVDLENHNLVLGKQAHIDAAAGRRVSQRIVDQVTSQHAECNRLGTNRHGFHANKPKIDRPVVGHGKQIGHDTFDDMIELAGRLIGDGIGIVFRQGKKLLKKMRCPSDAGLE